MRSNSEPCGLYSAYHQTDIYQERSKKKVKITIYPTLLQVNFRFAAKKKNLLGHKIGSSTLLNQEERKGTYDEDDEDDEGWGAEEEDEEDMEAV